MAWRAAARCRGACGHIALRPPRIVPWRDRSGAGGRFGNMGHLDDIDVAGRHCDACGCGVVCSGVGCGSLQMVGRMGSRRVGFCHGPSGPRPVGSGHRMAPVVSGAMDSRHVLRRTSRQALEGDSGVCGCLRRGHDSLHLGCGARREGAERRAGHQPVGGSGRSHSAGGLGGVRDRVAVPASAEQRCRALRSLAAVLAEP